MIVIFVHLSLQLSILLRRISKLQKQIKTKQNTARKKQLTLRERGTKRMRLGEAKTLCTSQHHLWFCSMRSANVCDPSFGLLRIESESTSGSSSDSFSSDNEEYVMHQVRNEAHQFFSYFSSLAYRSILTFDGSHVCIILGFQPHEFLGNQPIPEHP